jgi:hypothetical protein
VRWLFFGNTTAPTNFTITVSSPNTFVLFTATEQMTATASDGRALTGGTWSSDNTAVATVSTTGLVTPTGGGQATIIFAASSGQVGTKLLRVFLDTIAFDNISGAIGLGRNLRFSGRSISGGTAIADSTWKCMRVAGLSGVTVHDGVWHTGPRHLFPATAA